MKSKRKPLTEEQKAKRNAQARAKRAAAKAQKEAAKAQTDLKQSIKETQTIESELPVGDMVEKFTEATGIKKAVTYVFDKLGKDCGCEERKDQLNTMFTRKRELKRCMTEEEVERFLIIRHQPVPQSRSSRVFVAKTHSSLFGLKFAVPCTCNPSSWKAMTSDLNKVLDLYVTKQD